MLGFRQKSIRCVVLVVISTTLLLPSFDALAMKRLTLLLAVVDWIGEGLRNVMLEKAIDKTLGSDLELQLRQYKRELEGELRTNSESLGTLREQLEVVESQLHMMRVLLERFPSPEETRGFRDQVSSDLKKILSKLDRQDIRLDFQEGQVRELQDRLARIEELFGPADLSSSEIPEFPRVAVLAIGEPTFASTFEIELESRLRARNFDVASGRSSLRVGDLVFQLGDQVLVGDLVPLLVAEGFHVLVLARVVVTGYRELNYLGRTSEATNARLSLHAYVLQGQRSVSSGWSDTVEYTALNSEQKAGMALRGSSAQLAEKIHEAWQAHRIRVGTDSQ